jgi:hypothetical protein
MLFTVVALLSFSKPKSPNTNCIKKKGRKKKRILLVILSADVVAVGTYVDDSQEILRMACL